MSYFIKFLFFPALSLAITSGVAGAHPDRSDGTPPVNSSTCAQLSLMFNGMRKTGAVPPDMIEAVKREYEAACAAQNHPRH